MKKYFFVFFGPPGSGKGTQADLLSKKLNLPIFSPGEVLRSEVEKKTKLGKEVRPILDSGGIVGDDIIEKITNKGLKNMDISRGLIFDGYPRKSAQQRALMERLGKTASKNDLVLAILIDIKDNGIVKRLSGRRMCMCGESYHIKFKPPKKNGICDKCGRKLFIRDDDKPDVIKNRLKAYHDNINPILKEWEDMGKLIKIVGEANIKKIADDINKRIKNLL